MRIKRSLLLAAELLIDQAQHGDTDAQYKLAWYYLEDPDPIKLPFSPENEEVAAYWFEPSAIQGHKLAAYEHGMHMAGQLLDPNANSVRFGGNAKACCEVVNCGRRC